MPGTTLEWVSQLGLGRASRVRRRFLTCCYLLQYGRDSLAEIAREIEGKTEEEVRVYSKTFWERHTELADQDRIIKNIGESPLRLAGPEIQ